jgi:DNA polymerase II small subunit
LSSRVQQTILRILTQEGFQVSSEALEYLSHLESPLEAVEYLIDSRKENQPPPVLSKDYIHSILVVGRESEATEKLHPESVQDESVELEDISLATDSDWIFSIDKSPTLDDVGSEGLVDDFLQLFRNRYEAIKRIYRGRMDTQNYITPSVARTMKPSQREERARAGAGLKKESREDSIVLGIVKSKRESHAQNIIIELEDEESSISCVIPMNKKTSLSEKAHALLLDEIVCLKGSVVNTGFFIADDVIYPDVPGYRTPGRAERESYAAFISDLHCGSQEFLEDSFDLLMRWLNGRGVSSNDKDMVQNLRYLFIAGDLVDGISVYPSQREHLKISSNIDQYALLASKLKKLPKHIKVFCIPGNHDACRQALPRPPIPREFAEPLYKLSNVEMLGGPSQVTVEGTKILITHGDSLDDLVTNLPGASYVTPGSPMIELLKKRHLAPIYGGKTELAPLRRDWLVMEDIPDVIHFGHAHHNAVQDYRRVLVINSGTFQGQTDFMRKQGVVPTPAIVTVLNLQSGGMAGVELRDFLGEHVTPIGRIQPEL